MSEEPLEGAVAPSSRIGGRSHPEKNHLVASFALPISEYQGQAYWAFDSLTASKSCCVWYLLLASEHVALFVPASPHAR